MKRDDGAILALGLLTVFAASAEISRRRRTGSSNDGDDVDSQILDYGISNQNSSRGALQSRHAAQARAQAAMPDGQLARRAYLGGNLLEGMSFEEAVNADPRRIDGLITQEIAPLFGPAPSDIDHLYTHAAQDLRSSSGGRMTARALVDVLTRNDAIVMRFAMLPKSTLMEMLPDIEERMGRAAAIARKAARYASRPDDRHSWMELHDYILEVPSRLRGALSARLSPTRRHLEIE